MEGQGAWGFARRHWFAIGLGVLLVVALVVRLTYLDATAHGRLGDPDTAAYEALARDIHNGVAYRTSFAGGLGGFPAGLTRPPGYPAFLALISGDPAHHQVTTAIVQVVLSALAVIVIALLARALFTPLVGLAAGLLYAIDWATIIETPMSIADPLFAWVLGVGVLVGALALKRETRRGWLLAGSGLLLAVACLIKPAAEVMILGLCVFMLLAVRPRRLALLFIAASILPLVPWVVRNSNVYGEATISPISTANLYYETALGTYSYESPVSTNLNGLVARQNQTESVWDRRQLTPSQRSADYQRLAIDRIEKKWPIVIDQAVMGLLRTGFGTGRETVQSEWPGTPPSHLVTTYLPLLEICAVWALVAAGAWLAWFRYAGPRRITALLLLAVALALLPAAEPGGYARFRLPAVPLMAVLGGVGLVGAGQLVRRRTEAPQAVTA